MDDLRSADFWAHIDGWWETYIDTVGWSTRSIPALSQENHWTDEQWSLMDSWWDTYVAHTAETLSDNTIGTLEQEQNEYWPTLNSWWKTYVEIIRRDAVKLNSLFDDLDQLWEQSATLFNEDPLTTAWRNQTNSHVPLRTNQEENWSQWLVSLLEEPTGEFISELFDDRFTTGPASVQREVHLPATTGPNRYADILVFYSDLGMSIEVKQGDENYEKTLHTARLTEREYANNWYHVLLLPKDKKPAVQRTFGDAFIENGDSNPEICAESTDNISVVYWRDVSEAIRTVLLEGPTTDPHWEASAYLLCTIIEQRVADYRSRPEVAQMATATGITGTSQSKLVDGDEIEDQLNYLRKITKRHE